MNKTITLKFWKCVVTITTNKPEYVEKAYGDMFGNLKRITYSFKDVVKYLQHKDKELEIIVNSMK